MFLILWEFEVKPGCEQSFESAYGPDGAWSRLFGRDQGFHRTQLLKDPSRPRVYFTLDFWHTKAAYGSFAAANSEAYQALDRSTEYLTSRETHLGLFSETEPNTPSA